MKSPIIKHRAMQYIRMDMRGGPVFGLHLEDAALEQFGCAGTTLRTRLRQLRAAGFLSQERLLLAGGRGGNTKKRLVAYRCSAEQYHAWLAKAERVRSPAEPIMKSAVDVAGDVLFDNEPMTDQVGRPIVPRRRA